jgi:RNA polymerase sigma factor (sigma-70 family)
MADILEKQGPVTDQETIQRILQGEKALFEILIRRNNSVLYKIARGFGFNHQDSEDLMQETHVAAYLQLGKFEYRSSYKTWLTRIMVNKCIYKKTYGYHIKEKPGTTNMNENTQSLLMSLNENANHVVDTRELAKIIEYGIQQLPEAYKMVFILREVEGFNVAETAEVLRITTTNVKVRLNRAKALLQKALEKTYSSSGIYEFNLVYCDNIVNKVFERIGSL